MKIKGNSVLLLAVLLCLSAGCSRAEESSRIGKQVIDNNLPHCEQSIF